MSKPKPVLIYLAGPIDGITDEEACRWRLTLEPPLGVAFYSPAHAFYGTNDFTFPRCDHANRHVLQNCDGLLANLTGEGRGFGTIREIEVARLMNKPVAVAGDLTGTMMAYDVFCEPDIDSALMKLLRAIQDNRQLPNPLAVLLGGNPFFGTGIDESEDDET